LRLVRTQKRKQPRKELLSFVLLIRSRPLEPNLRTESGPEVIASTVVQEHDFVARFHAETEPASVEFNAAAGIKDAVGVAVNNIVDLVIDNACRDRTADAKVHKAALQQSENTHRASALDLEAK